MQKTPSTPAVEETLNARCGRIIQILVDEVDGRTMGVRPYPVSVAQKRIGLTQEAWACRPGQQLKQLSRDTRFGSLPVGKALAKIAADPDASELYADAVAIVRRGRIVL